MKIGARSTLAALIGLVVTFFVPADNEFIREFLASSSIIVRQMGSYLVYPFLFFNMAIATGLLKRTKRLAEMTIKVVGISIVTIFVMTILGGLMALVAPLSRIPIAFEQTNSSSLATTTSILSLFPTNAFSLFNASFFLPLALMAIIIGSNLAYDREIAEPTYNLFDSLGRIFYRLVSYYVRFSAIPITIFSFNFFYQLNLSEILPPFRGVVVLPIICITIIFGIYSLLYYFTCGKNNLLLWIKGMTTFPLFSFLSGDRMLSYSFSSVLSHENQGIRRDFGGYAVPLFALFGGAGTAFINAMAMIIILKSYNSLDITFIQVIMALCFSFTASIMVIFSPSTITSVLSLTCFLYGNNLSGGALILRPILPLLEQLAQFFDALTVILAVKIVAHYEGFDKFRAKKDLI